MRRRIRTVRVALAGCGVVGGALARLLAEEGEGIARRHGVRFVLTRVLVRDVSIPRDAVLGDLLTADVDDFLAAAAGAEVVVEAIGGRDPALRIAEAALGAGRRLVTANKALLAAHGRRLAARARAGRGRIDFEGAVGGGVPVVRALRESLAGTGVTSVRGVLNGTTNFILGRLAEGRRYADALAEAQAAGFAEADPARDVSGTDSADKLRILAWLAFGADPAALDVRRRGIVPGADRLAQSAAAVGGVCRLIAEAVRTDDGGVAAVVEPVVVPPGSDFARLRGEENLAVVQSRWNGTVRLSGPGAGGPATASALLGDLLRACRRLPSTRDDAPPPALDRRAHRWLVSLTTPDATIVARTLARAAIEAEATERMGGGLLVRTAPVSWSRVELLSRALSAFGARPVVARLEEGFGG